MKINFFIRKVYSIFALVLILIIETMEIKESKVIIDYKIMHGNNGGLISGIKGDYSFNSAEEAIREAKMFKENPRCHNSNMCDENVEYWKSQTFYIEKTIKVVETITSI